MSPSPIPVTPITPIVGGAGSFIAASGSVAASGLETALSGPWMIEEQSLNIQYIRLPYYGTYTQSHSLSGPTRTLSVQSTYITHIVEASYTRRKSYEIFSTSAWTQPQTFQIDAVSGDPYGNSYGSVGVSAMGPAGTINTKMPWYYRREWDSDIDTEVDQNAYGTQSFCYKYPNFEHADPESKTYQDGTNLYGDFDFVTNAWNPDSFQGAQNWTYNAWKKYQLMGPYSTSQESPLQIINYVNRVGTDIKDDQFFGIGANQPTIVNGWPFMDVGCSLYSVSRHDWS